MDADLTKLLNDWPYEPGQINVRLLEGEDGLPKIQMRLDLGILQMESSGRPDGQRPFGFESLLEYYEDRIEAAGEPESEPDDDEPGPIDAGGETLSAEDCRLLREEAVQYYHRYLSLLVLADYVGVIRDTTRNLRVIELCRDAAENDDDRMLLEQFRPYVTMMRARALASQMVNDSEPKAALLAIDEGIEAIRAIYEESGRSDEFDSASEVQLLRGMRDELGLKLPASQKSELRDRLRKALEEENYELAAILRDELKMMKE